MKGVLYVLLCVFGVSAWCLISVYFQNKNKGKPTSHKACSEEQSKKAVA